MTSQQSKMALMEELLHLIESASPQGDIVRRAEGDSALEGLLDRILGVGIVALSEADAVEAYNAASKGLDRVLGRIARDANRVGYGRARRSASSEVN